MYLGSLDRADEKRQVMKTPGAAVFAPAVDRETGHLVWVDNGTLMARAFDPTTGKTNGESVAAAQSVRFNVPNRYSAVSTSAGGTLVYQSNPSAAERLTFFDRIGRPLETIGPPDTYVDLRMSPDGARVAIMRGVTSSHSDGIAVLDVLRGIATPLASGFLGPWSPDGQRIAFATSPSGAPNVYTMSVNGGGSQVPPHAIGKLPARRRLVYRWPLPPLRATAERRCSRYQIRIVGAAVVRRSETVSHRADRLSTGACAILPGWTLDKRTSRPNLVMQRSMYRLSQPEDRNGNLDRGW